MTFLVKWSKLPKRRLLAGLWLLLWFLSLAAPVANTGHGKDQSWPGWSMLAIGWLGVLTAQFAWFANPIFFAGISHIFTGYAGGMSRLAIFILLVPLSADALLWHAIYGSAAGPVRILGFGPGYYLWLAAMAGLALTLAESLLADWIQSKEWQRRNAATQQNRL
jgi:hypothetical protein